jgi:AcrR family transcriptional regulator
MASPQPTARTQAERSERTHARLLAATITCLAEHGYRATTTRRVAGTAGVSLGALSHQFPSRLDLIATTLDDAVRRGAVELRARMDANASADPEELLNVLWDFFHSELFTVWIKVWLAAAEDEDLYARLAPIERRLNRILASITADPRPPEIPKDVWTRRLTAALHALRGLALQLALEPGRAAPRRDPWPAVRTELVVTLMRSSTSESGALS